ncbi:hypothetical protein C6505_27290, partial [Escherichia coli]|nr:hypothetical protein [Escherichia coli]
CPLTDFRGKTSIFSHPVYLFLRKFSLQDSRGGSVQQNSLSTILCRANIPTQPVANSQCTKSPKTASFSW